MTHIADYTTEDLAAGILGSTGPYAESLKRATNAINAAIAQAVAAEREACAQMGDQLSRYFDQHPGVKDKAAAESCRQYAAAIRARSNGAGRE